MAVNILTVVIFDLERDSKSILNMFASIFALAIVFDFSNRRHPRRWGLSIFLVLFSGLITLIISVIIVAPITANMAREIEGMFDSGEAAPAIESSKGGF